MEEKKQKRRYGSLVVDPPWATLQSGNYGAIHHYPLMKLDAIKAMPIADLMEETGHVWLWVTQGTLRSGYDVLEAWGIVPRSVFTWIKPRMTLGVYLRTACEYAILGTKGKSPILFNAQPNWGFFPLQGHSHKPEEFHKIVERCSPGPYLELFARRRQPGWDVWGNEIDSDIAIPGYPIPSYSEKFKQNGGANA